MTRPHQSLLAGLVVWMGCLITATRAAPPPLVRILVEPANSAITVNGILQDLSPVTLTNLPAGLHLIKATCPGYQTQQRSIAITPGQRVAVEILLERLNGLILFHSSPVGADIEVDGIHRGRTPCFVPDIPLGTHRVRILKTGHLPREMEISIPDRKPVRISVDLTSDTATVAIESRPPGATVSLNSITRGKTPCRIENLSTGTATLDLSFDGYEPLTSTLKLAAGEFQQLNFTLVPKPSELRIVSIPAGARIYIDNQFRGESPLEIKPLNPASYRIRAELPGHDTLARTIELRQATRQIEEFRLQANAGTLQVTTEPAGVQILVNGKDSGMTTTGTGTTDRISEPLKIRLLPPGEHEIRFEKKGFFPAIQRITIERDKILTVHRAMIRRFIPDCEVRTSTDVFRGVLVEIDPTGNVRLEIRPGIIKTIPAADIRSRLPIRDETPAP
ncbi:MAG: hypothetical protein A2340_11135 [Lentisphaerae bacterium RIFOXYB12_FULL_60_10]|nr:MAG: hypothetical protein A2340_11135 [Lentisphaerae bacterium RIFOXYB12_FULL_60_10]